MILKIYFIYLLGSLLLTLEINAQRHNVTNKNNKHDNGAVAVITQKPPGLLPEPRIVGGRIAEPGQFPYQVSLRLNGGHICGGSIISRNYVVTAAHCVTTGNPPKQFPANQISIRAGSVYVNEGGQVVNVASTKVHPSYNSFNNDIALVKLATPLELNSRVQPIELACQWPPRDVSAVTSGWGRLRTQGPVPDVLQYNTLKVLSHVDCKQRLGSVPTSVFCLGHTSGNGVCQGDSGGPAVYKNQLVGVTNFIIGGCGTTYPDGYASIAAHLNWIKSNSDA